MTSEHFEQIFEARHKRRRFQPSTVELAAGNRVEVDHPRAMVVRDGVAVYLRPGGVPVWFDHESVAAGCRVNRLSEHFFPRRLAS